VKRECEIEKKKVWGSGERGEERRREAEVKVDRGRKRKGGEGEEWPRMERRRE